MTEKELQKKFIDLLNRKNIPVYKTHGGMVWKNMGGGQCLKCFQPKLVPMKLKAGFSDLVIMDKDINENCLITPITMFVELKSDIGRLKPNQEENLSNLSDLGHYCYVFRPRNWEQLKIDFRKYGSIFTALEHSGTRYYVSHETI